MPPPRRPLCLKENFDIIGAMTVTIRKIILYLFPILVVIFFIYSTATKPASEKAVENYAELSEIKNHAASFSDLRDFFQDIAKEKGAEYAFEVLKQADVPSNTDMHLMGHAVGDILYQQKGLEGIKICTDDFRNACSHSIVVGLFSDNGDKALPEIAQACRQASGL